jgi:Domain of unknown function (DUF4164)
MAVSPRLENALARFNASLRQCEGALTRARDMHDQAKAYKIEAETLRQDRVTLAQDLELIRTKASDLVSINGKAVGRIDAAMSRIRAVLHSNTAG